ncbi:MAG: hypothetical protein A4E35_02339 [Methanoregula sp. PtaU1.Bin051]|nr:MAG: hypothetical protein A4E35_02339 [Methanoregula sp. PtaU1.Bin051]
MKDDAVSPVIAAMLVLAVIVTLFAAWNAILVPSLKQESEIVHIREVESGILRFASDIDTAASLKTNLHLTERIPLGGGDIPFNSLRSGGMIRIQRSISPYMSMNLTNNTLGTSEEEPVSNHSVYMSRILYHPAGNFWQDQGYSWQYGYTNVTKGEIQTPLEYSAMENVSYPLTESILSVETLPSYEDNTKCSLITIKSVNITPSGGQNKVSGNGIGTLILTSSVSPMMTFTKITGFNITLSGDSGFRNATNSSVSRMLANNIAACSNIRLQYPGQYRIGLVFDAIPNMTVRREITEIILAAT